MNEEGSSWRKPIANDKPENYRDLEVLCISIHFVRSFFSSLLTRNYSRFSNIFQGEIDSSNDILIWWSEKLPMPWGWETVNYNLWMSQEIFCSFLSFFFLHISMTTEGLSVFIKWILATTLREEVNG